MPAPISIVIPTLNAAQALPACLGTLVEGLSEGVLREVVVCDGGSTDATVDIAEGAGARVVTGPAGRGGQLRQGMEAARGEWLFALHADCYLPPGWPDLILAHMAQHPDKAGYFSLKFRSKAVQARAVAAWANARSRWAQMPYGDQGLLLSRQLYEAIGGYQEVPLMEDVLIARALRGRLVPLPATISTSADRYEAQGWARRGWRNARLRWRHRLGADPRDLARDYSSN